VIHHFPKISETKNRKKKILKITCYITVLALLATTIDLLTNIVDEETHMATYLSLFLPIMIYI